MMNDNLFQILQFQYKKRRQEMLDDQKVMLAFRLALIGVFIAIPSGLAGFFLGNHPFFLIGFGIGFFIAASGITYGHFLVITRSDFFKSIKSKFEDINKP